MFAPSPYGCDILEAAVLLALQGRRIANGTIPVLRTSIVDYWIASRTRLDRWSRALHGLERDREEQADDCQTDTIRRRRWLVRFSQELLVSEVLARVWTALATRLDHPAHEEIELLSRSVFSGHLDVRRRILAKLLDDWEMGRARNERLNGLRRRCERWTDMLLGCLMELGDVREFGFDDDRVAHYHQSFFRNPVNAHVAMESLYLCSLRQEVGGVRPARFPNHPLNERIVLNLIGCFGSDLIDAVSRQEHLWRHRLGQQTSELQSLVGNLVGG